MDHIKALYEQEIDAYKQQIKELRARNKSCDDKIETLINKNRSLEDLIEKANVANKDLNMAFEHVREENLRLQLRQEHQPAPAITHHEPEPKAIEAAESLTWITERDRMNQRIKFLEREIGRYQRDNATLGKQVRHLLRSLEEERGMIIRHQSQSTNDEGRMIRAADVIDKHLVTFESIEELQQQNQKLLTLVKNLSAEQEERDITVESEEVKKLSSQIEELSKQLETIKSDRDRVLNALNTIHKERDLFKILLCKTREVEHMTPEIFQRMVSVACSSGPAIEDQVERSAEKAAHIEDLKSVAAKAEEHAIQIKKELEDLRKQKQEEIELKDQLLEKAHSKILDETKRADVLNERNEVLENNIQALTTEYDETRAQFQKLLLESEQLKSKIEELSESIQSLDRVKSNLEKLLDAERQRAQDAIVELSQSREQVKYLEAGLEREAQIRQKEMAEFFQTIQDRHNADLQEHLRKEMELQVKLEDQIRVQHELQAQLTAQTNGAETQSDRVTGLQDQLVQAENLVSETKSQLDQGRAQWEETKAKLANTLAQLVHMTNQLNQAEADFREMQDQRNFERHLYIRLKRRLSKRRVPIKTQVKCKVTPKRVRLNVPMPAQQEPQVEPQQIPHHDIHLEPIQEVQMESLHQSVMVAQEELPQEALGSYQEEYHDQTEGFCELEPLQPPLEVSELEIPQQPLLDSQNDAVQHSQQEQPQEPQLEQSQKPQQIPPPVIQVHQEQQPSVETPQQTVAEPVAERSSTIRLKRRNLG